MPGFKADDAKKYSRQNFANDFAMHIGEPAVDAIVTESELLVVDTQLVQQRGVQIVTIGGRARRLVRPLVAFAIAHAASKSAARHPTCERKRIVIAAFATLAARH